jgi:methyl-accepting chemotaxis protein
VANDGGILVKSTLSSIKDVSKFSEQIFKLLDLISKISSETDLLAMNAAIEASHAGEHGKGFSIVAGEIRKLSEDTSRNTNEIGNVVRNIIKKIEDSVILAEKAGSGLDMIMDYSQQNSKVIEELMLAIAEQNNGFREMLRATQELVKITESVKFSMQEQKSATAEFSTALKDLRDFSLTSRDNIKSHLDNLTQLIGSLDRMKLLIEDNIGFSNVLHDLVEKFVLEGSSNEKSEIRLIQ